MISVVTRQLRGSGRLECNRLPKFRAKEHSQTLDSSLLREDEREGYGYETGFRVLPYLLQDSFTRDRRLVDVKTVVLENRHLRAEFWPQYGARLASLYDKDADREILYSNKTGRYYIYSTTDGMDGWGGWYYTVFSSDDLLNWRYDGVALDLRSQSPWADGNAWAPAIEEKLIDGQYKYFLYFSGNPRTGGGKQIGVAVADSPAGPFTDIGHPIVTDSPVGYGQQIDVDVFTDPVSGKSYLYWGNGYMAGAELNKDMLSIKPRTLRVMTPEGGTLQDYAYREAPYVFYRNGLYYFMWSVDDTGAANYHVAYGTSRSPLGPIEVAADPIVIIQDPAQQIYGTAHNSILQIPGSDKWYIIYHRINRNYISNGPGTHREVCIDRMEFNDDGTIKRVVPSR